MRGRPRIPTKLKLLQGKRVENESEPQPPGGAPACPTWLDGEAKAEWKRVVADLDSIGMLCRVDRATLASYCQAWAEFHDATKTLQKEGRDIPCGKAGYLVPHPAVSRQRSAWKAVAEFSGRFGLDPSSRSRLQVAPKSGERSDLEKFIGG